MRYPNTALSRRDIGLAKRSFAGMNESSLARRTLEPVLRIGICVMIIVAVRGAGVEWRMFYSETSTPQARLSFARMQRDCNLDAGQGA